MPLLKFAVCLAGCAWVAGCAMPPGDNTLTAPRIMEACMKVELPKAIDKFRAEGKSAEDAGLFAHLVCQTVANICAKEPLSSGCPKSLTDYGLRP
jgi:hypothetical protein